MKKLPTKPILTLRFFAFTFAPTLIPTLAVLLLLPILIKLAFWQLHRAEFKQALTKQFNARPKHRPLTLKEVENKDKAAIEYYPLTVRGHYDNQHLIYIDNRMHQHRAGYHVLIPFLPENSHRIILVNQGWIARRRDRTQLPATPTIPGEQTITGLIKWPPKKVFVLSDTPAGKQWPLVLTAIQFKKIQAALHQPAQPFLLLLTSSRDDAFVRSWKPVTMSASRHIGYAVQWFLLALTLLIIFIVVNTHRGKNGPPRKDPKNL